MSPCMWLVHQLLSLTHDHLCFVRNLIWASFQPWVLVTETVAFGHDNVCFGINLSLLVRVSRWSEAFACHVRHVMTHFHWLSAMSIKLPRICSLFSLVKISWYSWHFAALNLSSRCIFGPIVLSRTRSVNIHHSYHFDYHSDKWMFRD